MKKIVFLLTAAVVMTASVPAFAQTPQDQKDECLLASKNCVDQVDDIYKRIHRLQKEVKKGQRVYTPAELKKLQDKLAETQDLLNNLEKPGR